MTIISDAERALARNWRVVAFYIVGVVLFVAGFDLVREILRLYVPDDVTPKPVWFVSLTLVLDVLLAAVVAAFQSVSFAAVGAEIDRPLWKHQGPRDALKRFFGTWFIIALIGLALVRIVVSLFSNHMAEAAASALMPYFLWMGAYMPLGVCIMYGGRLVWREVPDRLSPILHVAPKALVAAGLGLFQFVIQLFVPAFAPASKMAAIPFFAALNFPLLLLECLAFAIMWHACIEYRDTAPDRDDDFDF